MFHVANVSTVYIHVCTFFDAGQRLIRWCYRNLVMYTSFACPFYFSLTQASARATREPWPVTFGQESR